MTVQSGSSIEFVLATPWGKSYVPTGYRGKKPNSGSVPSGKISLSEDSDPEEKSISILLAGLSPGRQNSVKGI
jgi:hypothetical protein